MTKFVFGILFTVFFVAAYQGIPQALGQDGCDGLEGAAYGLCNAYCEAMDCDGEPQASDKACDKVLVNYQKKTDILMPCSDPCLDTECRQGEMCVNGECLCGDNQCIGDELCVGGVCQPVVCHPGFADCSGNGQCDTDLSNDDANCGECGVSCNIFEACSGGACLPIQCTIGGVCPLGTFCQTGVCVLIPQ